MNEVVIEIIKISLTVIALLFTCIQIMFLVSEIKSNKKWNSQNAAFHYCAQYSELFGRENSKINNILTKFNGDNFNELFNIDTKQGRANRKEISTLLQYFEKLSIGILCDYFDEEVVRRNMNLTFIKTFVKLEPYIFMRRQEENTTICTHFERVAKIWIELPMNYPFRTVPSNRKKCYFRRKEKI